MNLQRQEIDGIPAQWALPEGGSQGKNLAIFLPGFGGSNDQVAELLRDIAARGCIALSIDPWQHGARGTESREQLMARVFSSFRKNMWPIIGHTTIDVLRVINWTLDTFDVRPKVRIGGLSMGGDVAIAAAGIDARIERVFAVVATPDWLRPGMRHAKEPSKLVEQGEADAYAQFFFDALDPMSHLARYFRKLELTLVCGQNDTHVPPDSAHRFQRALDAAGAGSNAQINIQTIEGRSHLDIIKDRGSWWPRALSELAMQ